VDIGWVTKLGWWLSRLGEFWILVTTDGHFGRLGGLGWKGFTFKREVSGHLKPLGQHFNWFGQRERIGLSFH